MTHTKQTVYLPVKVEDELPKESGYYKTIEEGTSFFESRDRTWWDGHFKKRFPKHWLKPQEGYFFTLEQLNQLLSDVIKDALFIAADNAQTECDEGGETGFVNKKSITSTFDITYKKHKV